MTAAPPFRGFFFDANMPERIARAMQDLDENVVWIFDEFKDGDPGDHVWLPWVASEGLVVITRDLDMISPALKGLYRKHNAGGFYLHGGNDRKCDVIQYVVRQWPLLKRTARTTDRPFLLRVRPKGWHMKSLLGKLR